MNRSFAKIAILAIAAASLAACTATRTQKTAGEQIDDSVLTAKVKAALIQEPSTKARQIDVETFRGTVQLNGYVDSADAKAAAGRVAQSVEGVQRVDNNLSVQEGSRTAGEAVDDSMITAKVKAALIADPTVKAHEVNVETRDGSVQLSGFVDNSAAKNAAADVARRVSGVKDVQNDLQVKQR
jgi:hyperosmotically inducible periplasmic protein